MKPTSINQLRRRLDSITTQTAAHVTAKENARGDFFTRLKNMARLHWAGMSENHKSLWLTRINAICAPAQAHHEAATGQPGVMFTREFMDKLAGEK